MKKLTRKQKNFADTLINNPKISATQAVIETYNATTRHSAEQIAHENLRKPEIVSYLERHLNDTENILLNTLNEYKNEEDLSKRKHSTDIAMWIHDKVQGKATQRTETHVTSVNLNLDLTNITPLEDK
jgi:phage terminase small subunit